MLQMQLFAERALCGFCCMFKAVCPQQSLSMCNEGLNWVLLWPLNATEPLAKLGNISFVPMLSPQLAGLQHALTALALALLWVWPLSVAVVC
jgi:hypothetical protein